MLKRFSLRSALLAMALIGLALFLWSNFCFNQLKGEPIWLSVGKNVYRFSDIEAAQQQTVRFASENKWFEEIPKIPWREIPTDINGTTLDLEMDRLPELESLSLKVKLKANQNIQRRYEHRYNNEQCWKIISTKTIRLQQNDKKRTSSQLAVRSFLGSLFHRTVAALQAFGKSCVASIPSLLCSCLASGASGISTTPRLRLN